MLPALLCLGDMPSPKMQQLDSPSRALQKIVFKDRMKYILGAFTYYVIYFLPYMTHSYSHVFESGILEPEFVEQSLMTFQLSSCDHYLQY